jgi:hypothetical protein
MHTDPMGKSGRRAADRRIEREAASNIADIELEAELAKGVCFICGTLGCEPSKDEVAEVEELVEQGLTRLAAEAIVRQKSAGRYYTVDDVRKLEKLMAEGMSSKEAKALVPPRVSNDEP